MCSLDDKCLGIIAIGITGAINTSTKQDTTKILLVYNESDNTSVLCIDLGEGFRVDSFNNSTLVLSSFRPNFYSLLTLDINMLKMNGYE